MSKHEDERARVFRRAESIHREIDELLRIDYDQRHIMAHKTYQQRAREWCNEDPEGRTFAREFVALLYDELGEATSAGQLDAWLCHGLVAGGVEHAWIAVEGDPNLVHPIHESQQMEITPEQLGKAGAWGAWRYIIDPCLPSAVPGLIMWAPPSPFQGFYHETERFRSHPAAPPLPADAAAQKAMMDELQEMFKR